ncbi:MAG: helical backbone metal receptor [Myxococcaceae bacterium]|nr:helical backbone metal receptor [Myxococcaceae bacterium]
MGMRGRFSQWGVLCCLLVAFGAATSAQAHVLRLGPKPPVEVKRVVTLAPSLTETVLALGAGETLVGVSRFDEAPAVAKLPRVGGYNDPSLEAVLALSPQVVLAQMAPANQAAVEKLAELGISVIAFSLTSLADAVEAIEVVGHALGKVKAAQALNKAIADTRAATQARAKARAHRPTVLFVVSFQPLVVAGPGSFIDELLQDVGAQNIAAKSVTPFPQFSLERVVKAQPDVIIDAAFSAEGREWVQRLPALKKTRWVKMSSGELWHPGPALADGLLKLEAWVYPP